jgi:hypothetical protein
MVVTIDRHIWREPLVPDVSRFMFISDSVIKRNERIIVELLDIFLSITRPNRKLNNLFYQSRDSSQHSSHAVRPYCDSITGTARPRLNPQLLGAGHMGRGPTRNSGDTP